MALLLGDAGIAAVLGDRIHWDLVPDKTVFPYARLQRIDGGHLYTMKRRTDLEHVEVQVDIWATDALAALTARRAVEDRVSNYSGQVGHYRFQKIAVLRMRSGADEGAGAERRLWRQSLDLRLSGNKER